MVGGTGWSSVLCRRVRRCVGVSGEGEGARVELALECEFELEGEVELEVAGELLPGGKETRIRIWMLLLLVVLLLLEGEEEGEDDDDDEDDNEEGTEMGTEVAGDFRLPEVPSLRSFVSLVLFPAGNFFIHFLPHRDLFLLGLLLRRDPLQPPMDHHRGFIPLSAKINLPPNPPPRTRVLLLLPLPPALDKHNLGPYSPHAAPPRWRFTREHCSCAELRGEADPGFVG